MKKRVGAAIGEVLSLTILNLLRLLPPWYYYAKIRWKEDFFQHVSGVKKTLVQLSS